MLWSFCVQIRISQIQFLFVTDNFNIITSHAQSCGKVMFSHASVCSQAICLPTIPWVRQTSPRRQIPLRRLSPPPHTPIRSTGGRYASHCNAYLFAGIFSLNFPQISMAHIYYFMGNWKGFSREGLRWQSALFNFTVLTLCIPPGLEYNQLQKDKWTWRALLSSYIYTQTSY